MTLDDDRHGSTLCSVCGEDWMSGWNHGIWCSGSKGVRPKDFRPTLVARHKAIAQRDRARQERDETTRDEWAYEVGR